LPYAIAGRPPAYELCRKALRQATMRKSGRMRKSQIVVKLNAETREEVEEVVEE
jgi:hypothetical protein